MDAATFHKLLRDKFPHEPTLKQDMVLQQLSSFLYDKDGDRRHQGLVRIAGRCPPADEGQHGQQVHHRCVNAGRPIGEPPADPHPGTAGVHPGPRPDPVHGTRGRAGAGAGDQEGRLSPGAAGAGRIARGPRDAGRPYDR